MRHPGTIVLGLLVAALVTVVSHAAAAAPVPRAVYLFHDHDRPGDGWHVELTVSRDAKRLGQVVLHSERCDATVLTRRVEIRAGGRVDSAGAFTTGNGTPGSWTLRGFFSDARHFEGEMRVTAGRCDGGLRRFVAHTRAGRHDHPAGAHRGHKHLSGTPAGRYPDLGRAPARHVREVRRLWRRSWQAARTRFTSERVARALGYTSLTIRRRPPLLFHLRHSGYDRDDRLFDARRVESLVYWRPALGPSILIAFMYRLPLGVRPPLGGELLGWHAHGKGTTKMTHVWLTGDLRTALANCLPVEALERAHPGLHVGRSYVAGSAESIPCPIP